MKRFLLIFVICFGLVVGVIGGVFGIKYLKGDFNEVVVNPENISFEFEEYDVVDDFYITISTTTEGVTATNVSLSFAKGTVTKTHGTDYWTDSVIVIPKTVQIGVPFKVQLVTTADSETDGLQWIKGGISNIVATSECVTTPKANASVYVDVPVYKTELVVLSGDGQVETSDSYIDALTYIEGQTGLVKSAEKSLNAGDTFYVGLKYYPARSAYKYSKISSSNLLVEYKDQILAKIEELGLTETYSEKLDTLSQIFEGEQDTKTASIQDIINAFSAIVDFSQATNTTKVGQLTQYLTELKTQFESYLKYYTFEETANNEQTYLTKLDRVGGTNLYKIQATTDSMVLQSGVTASLYGYTFANSKIESDTLSAVGNNYNNLLSTLENLYSEQGNAVQNKQVDKATLSFGIVDVDVDTITVNGEIQDFAINKVHTIYLAQNGTGSATTSYLGLTLSNSNVQTVDLQSKMANIGVRFEKRESTSTWSDAEEIEFVDEQNYTTVVYNGKTYYLPLGTNVGYSNSYWQIYSDEYISNDVRAVLVYFKGDLTDEITNEQVVASNDYPLFRLEDPSQTEQTIKWADTSELTLGVINMTGVIDMEATDTDGAESVRSVSYNKEIDLANYIDIPEDNYYQTHKFFLYSDDTDAEALSPIYNYFYVTENTSKQYQFYGTTKNLYELDGSILKLKTYEWPETYTVKVMFATIKTGALRTPILTPIYDADGETVLDYRYTFVKYSAVKDNIVENLSALSVNFEGYVNTLSGIVSNTEFANSINEDVAGVASDGLFKVAQNSTNALKVVVNTAQDQSFIKSLIDSGDLTIQARISKNNSTSYITYTAEYVSGKNYFSITTLGNLANDIVVRLYLVYFVDGQEYLFPVSVSYNGQTFHKITIVKNTSASASFNFLTTVGVSVVDADEIDYISVVTAYAKNADGNDNTEKFEKSFYVYYTDPDKNVADMSQRKITINDSTTAKVLVEVIDFLGNVTTKITDWYLTTTNQTVATVQENQILNFVGTCTTDNPVTVGLYLANNVLQQSVKFVVENTGTVSKVVANAETINESVIYDEQVDVGVSYNFAKQTVAVSEVAGAEINIDDLLRIYYKLNQETTSANKLPMLVYVANVSSLDNLQAIVSDDYVKNLTSKADDSNYYETNNITTIHLSKNLGSVVSVDLLFKCVELGITQAVTVKFNQSITITNVAITNVATGNAVVLGSSVYSIYAGIGYHIELTSATEKFYYYIEGKESTIIEITDKSFDIMFEDGCLAQQKIHILATNQTPTIGDLNYILEFNVQKNISQITLNQITKELDGDTLSIALTDLFERISATETGLNNLSSYAILGDITFEYGTNYATDNAKIKSITALEEYSVNLSEGQGEDRYLEIKFNAFSDELNIVIYIKCNGEVLGSAISIKILPQDLKNTSKNVFTNYNGNKAIVVSNGQTVNTFFNELFTSGSVSVDSTFYSTYTTTESGNTKVVLSVNTLFENTNSKVSVTENNISSTYTIIISKLAFPFVEFVDVDNNSVSYANLDIYDLFVETDDLIAYYNNANISAFEPVAPVEGETPTLTLADTTDDTESVFKLTPFGVSSSIKNAINFNSTIGSIEVLQGSLTASSYASIEHTSSDGSNGKAYLSVNPVGEDVYLKVNLNILPDGSSAYYEIPVLVKLEVTQTLRVTYPFAELYVDSTDTNYGSDEYDNEFMTTNSSTFEQAYKYMEYLSFNVNGLASLNLVDSNYNRFAVYKGATVDASYDGSYKFEIVKISKNVNGVWSFVNSSELANYAYFADGTLMATNGTLTISNVNGGTAFRVKLKVTTSGGAVSYYYVSAGEQVPLTLMRSYNSTNVSVGTTDSITVSAGNVLLIGSANGEGYSYAEVNPKFYYYLSNSTYNQELKFRLFDTLGNVILSDDISEYVTIDKNKLTIAVQPTGANFVIQIYTSYGVLSTVNVAVEPSISVNFVSGTIYSGATYNISEIINVITGAGVSSANPVSVECVTTSIYFTCDGNSIIFENIPAGEVKTFDMHLRITVNIDTKPFTFEQTFSSVTLTPRITAKTFEGEGFYRDETDTQLTTYTEDNGMIELSNQLWKNMFNDLKAGTDIAVENESDLDFYIEGTNVTENVTASSITWTLSSVLTDDDVRNWTFAIKDKSTGEAIASAYAKITIRPQYNVVINYPVVVSDVGDSLLGLTCEYVQMGSSVSFIASNFSNIEQRISVKKTDTGDAFDDYQIVFEGVGGPYDGKVTGSKSEGFAFNFTTSDFANKTEIELKFNVVIGEGDSAKTYATYVVKVLKDSPFTLDADYLDTIYYGYASEDEELFNNVDVLITLPTVAGFVTGQQVDIYTMIDGTKTNIATKIYYRAGDIVRGTLAIGSYAKNLTVYICETDAGNPETDNTCSTEFNVRATLKYQGYQVQYKHYSNILGEVSTTLLSDSNNVQTYSIDVEKAGSLSIINSESKVVSGVFVDFTFDIKISDDHITQDTALVLYANAKEAGQSFVELFNVTDSLGNSFWYNQINTQKIISLGVKDINGAIECLPVEPQTIEETLKYDYLLKPLGAKNDGTDCLLTFTYTYTGAGDGEQKVYTKQLYVKVISDIEYEIYNNDGTTTPNSATNPLKIKADSDDIVFVSLAQTKYIYAYSKYSDTKPNVAQLFTYTVTKLTESATDFLTVKKLSDPTCLMLDITPGASFGNKNIELILKDMYGFEIKYYIELIADINVTSITTVAGKVFEGDSITVYNKNASGATGSSGSIALTLSNGNDKDTTTNIQILEATFWFDDSTKYSDAVIDTLDASNTKLSFNFLSYDDFWDTSKGITNGASLVGKLIFVIVKEDASTDINSREKYSFEIGFTLYKKYAFDLATENTFVRENVPVDLTHFIDVYDYKQESYLGKPELDANEQIKAKLYFNNSSLDTASGKTQNLLTSNGTTLYNYISNELSTINTASSKTSVENAWTNLAEYGIQQNTSNQGSPVVANEASFETGLYSSYLQKNDSGELMTYADIDGDNTYEMTLVSSITPDEGDAYVYIKNNKGDKIYTQTYDLDNLGIFLRIRATHKTNGSTIEREDYLLIQKDSSGYFYIDYREALGSDSSNFGANVTTQDYYFDIDLCSIGETISNIKKVATTIPSEQGETNAVKNQILTSITSGSLYTVAITNSSNLATPTSLAFTLNGDTNNVYVIKTYLSSDNNTETGIVSGSHVFNLYDGQYTDSIHYSKDASGWNRIDNPTIHFEGQVVSLYTGTINSTNYVNGLSDVDVKASKNIIASSYKVNADSEENTTLDFTGTLSGDTFDYNESYGIYYQSIQLNSITIKYYEYVTITKDDDGKVTAVDESKVAQQNAIESHSETVNITLKYTGVNTDGAYVGSTMHYVYVTDMQLDADGALSSALDIEFADWADGFKLKTGVGVANILAGFENKDFTGSNNDETGSPVANLDSLVFEPGEVKGTSTTTTSSLFDISTSGTIQLKGGFIPNSYYISIIVKCAFNSGSNSKAIGTIYLSFVAVDKVEINCIGNKQYKLDITNYVGDDYADAEEMPTSEVKLEGAITQYAYKDGSVWYAIFDNSNESIKQGRSLLTVGSTSKYVYLNINEVALKNNATSLTIYQITGSTYAIYGKDIYLSYLGNFISAIDYSTSEGVSLGSISICQAPVDYKTSPAEIVVGTFTEGEYFEFGTLTGSIGSVDNNGTYYINVGESYCKVTTVKIQTMFVDELSLDGTTIDLTGKNIYTPGDIDGTDLYTYLNSKCTEVKINGNSVTLSTEGTNQYIKDITQTLDTNWVELSFVDDSGTSQTLLIKIANA